MARAARSPARRRSIAAPAATSADHEDSDEVQEAVMKILEESLGSSAAEMQVEQEQGRLSPTRGRHGAVARFAPFLQEVRRRVKVEREALRALLRKPLPLPARLRSAGERVHRRRVAATQKAQQVKSQVVRRVRKSLTGAEDRRLRDLVRENTMRMRKALERPPVVRLRDKVSFLLGVLGCFVLEAVALLHPEHFWVCYSVYIVPLLLARVYYYKVLRWHYFLLDFCYASNLLCLAQIFVWPDSFTLFVINFAQTTGPLAMAIPTWRNSLVFHSLDKVTSAYIHALPPLLCFLMRWHPPAGWHDDGWPAFSPALPEHLDIPWAVGCALGGYIAWQAAHLVLTELVFLPAPDSDTSIRTLTRPKPAQPPPGCYTGITKPVYVLCTQLGVMRKGELFDPEHWKTKLVFVSVQLVYTALTIVPACYLWSSRRAHLLYLGTILSVCVWNGASYYIEVFSKAYRKQFETVAAVGGGPLGQAVEVGGAPEVPRFRADLLCEGLTGSKGIHVGGADGSGTTAGGAAAAGASAPGDQTKQLTKPKAEDDGSGLHLD